MRNDPLIVLTTAGSSAEAKKLAQGLLQRRLAACVNLIPHVNSWYRWKGRVEQGREILLLIKTSKPRLRQLSQFIKQAHSYEVPELLALPILWGDRSYLNWLRQNIKIV